MQIVVIKYHRLRDLDKIDFNKILKALSKLTN